MLHGNSSPHSQHHPPNSRDLCSNLEECISQGIIICCLLLCLLYQIAQFLKGSPIQCLAFFLACIMGLIHYFDDCIHEWTNVKGRWTLNLCRARWSFCLNLPFSSMMQPSWPLYRKTSSSPAWVSPSRNSSRTHLPLSPRHHVVYHS